MPYGGGLAELSVPTMSQSYRRAVQKNPPKGEYFLQVYPPTKQGSGYHYGGCVKPSDPQTSTQPNRSYVIWRKWEDCLELQRTVEREFSYLSAKRRKQLGHDHLQGLYLHGATRAASFESLPSGPEPLSMALDIHTHLPRLSKKTALFGRPSAALLSQRAEDFQFFIDALFTLHTPLMDEVLQQRAVRDWFGYWRRDKEGEAKGALAQGMAAPSPASLDGGRVLNGSPSATSTSEIEESLVLAPQLSANSGSSDGGSSLGKELRRSSRSEFGDDDADDELLDTFPLTPAIGPISTIPNPVIHLSDDGSTPDPEPHRIHQLNKTEITLATPPSIDPPKASTLPAPYTGFSVRDIVAPPSMFRSCFGPAAQQRSPSISRSATASSTSVASTINPSAATHEFATALGISDSSPRPVPSKLVIPMLIPSRQRPGTATGSSPWSAAQRQGKIFIVEPERPRSAGGIAFRNDSMVAPSTSFKPHEVDESSHAEVQGPQKVEKPLKSPRSVANTRGFDAPHPASTSLARSNSISGRRRSSTFAYDRSPPTTSSTCLTNSSSLPSVSSDDVLTPPTSAHAQHAFPTSLNPKQSTPEHAQGHHREVSNTSTVGSLIDVSLLPWLGAHRHDEGDQTAPAVNGRRRPSWQNHPASAVWGRSSRGTRHSISSIESYMSDSSIDAALSTMRLAQSNSSIHPSELARGSGSSDGGLPARRSMSTDGSARSRWSIVHPEQRKVDEDEEGFSALDPEMASHLSFRSRSSAESIDQHSDIRQARSALADEDDTDSIDAYYYSPLSSFTESGKVRRHAMVTSSSPPTSWSPPRRGPRYPTRTPSIASYGGLPDDQFVVKILYPSSTDCGAVVLRIPRVCTFERFQEKLHTKFHEAEGVELDMLRKGFRLGYRSPSPRTSMVPNGSEENSMGGPRRTRTFSIGSGNMVDPTLLSIIKNQDDWELAIPSSREKLILQILVDN
ncbi:hypothetical protein FRB97_004944 [Tulasnella sp. 331]|nr:hypothetical protein FRB97_004944 [Tulasnella sp. 331]